jgi:deoxyribonuclease (pyrimidine dimer)
VTRINLVPPSELMDQHLMAEFREIKMIGPALRRSLRSCKPHELCIPEEYVLGKGHVMFFYDKGEYLRKRHGQLVEELWFRGFNITYNEFPIEYFEREILRKDYSPTPAALALIRARIAEKLAARPGWYRYKGMAK